MADPYAAREEIPAGEQPADAGPARELVDGLGGRCALDLAGLAEPPSGAADRFVAVVVRDEGLLPPVAAIDAAFAVLLLLRAGDSSGPANDALAALDRAQLPVYLLKQGLVAGPPARPGAYVVEAELIERVLGAALAGEVGWEWDPDFGYRIAARVPGVEGIDADALCPRLLYASADRVYEHAETVVAIKRDRHRRSAAVAGIDERIPAASGWPIEPTGSRWKD